MGRQLHSAAFVPLTLSCRQKEFLSFQWNDFPVRSLVESAFLSIFLAKISFCLKKVRPEAVGALLVYTLYRDSLLELFWLHKALCYLWSVWHWCPGCQFALTSRSLTGLKIKTSEKLRSVRKASRQRRTPSEHSNERRHLSKFWNV